ncbi:MAG: DUF167 domain-containing protein [Methanomicrobiales archaeon]|nr:DUF167 domain-containing protein [Methanomicrobiales archaeon]
MHTVQEAITEHPDGTVIAVLVTPGAKKSCLFSSYHQWRNALECEIQAPAQTGKANRELIQRCADRFSIPAKSISILTGERSSRKLILIRGISRELVLDMIGEQKER